MRASTVLMLLFTSLIAGCSNAPHPESPGTPPLPEDQSPLGLPISGVPRDAMFGGHPLILDRTDLRFGTTVHLDRLPTRKELYDFHNYRGLAHVVITLTQWPQSYARLQELDSVPGESDLMVILPGYPPHQQAAEAWNLLSERVRIIVVVNDLPPHNAAIDDLNKMRGLERVIVHTDDPHPRGFERLQRPLSFRTVLE